MARKTSKDLKDHSQRKERLKRDELNEFYMYPVRKSKWPYPMLTTIVAVALTLLVYFTTVDQPLNEPVSGLEQDVKITFEPKIQSVTDEDFAKVGILGELDATKDDFQKFTLNVEVQEENDILLESVSESVNWKERMDAIDGVNRYFLGTAYYHDDSRGKAVYHVEFVFYTKGLTEKEIFTAFDGALYTVVVTGDESMLKKEFKVGDYLEFDK